MGREVSVALSHFEFGGALEAEEDVTGRDLSLASSFFKLTANCQAQNAILKSRGVRDPLNQ